MVTKSILLRADVVIVVTVVVSTDGTSHEDSEHDHFGLDSENRYPKNVSKDIMPAVISPNESKNEKNVETNHTGTRGGCTSFIFLC